MQKYLLPISWALRNVAIAMSHFEAGVPASRFAQASGVKPHLSDTFKLSSDPFFSEKVRDVTGLYLNPPDNAMAFKGGPVAGQRSA